MDNEVVFIELKDKMTLDINDSIKISDVADVYSYDEKAEKRVKDIVAYKSATQENWDYLNAVDLAKLVLDKYPNLNVELLGASDIMLEIKSLEKTNSFLEIIKLIFVSLTLFFGAALGIMYFHEDVNMTKSLEDIYFSLTGENKSNPLLMNIPYSIGLGIGMLTFFVRNKSSSKRRRMEPGPMEMELYLYDLDMEDYIKNSMKKNRTKE